jgi:molybdate transport system substrate-binding protein
MPDVTSLAVLSAGAAKGVVEAYAPAFRSSAGAELTGTFGAVGAIREQFLADAPCDVLILTAAQLDALAADGRVERDTIEPLGRVDTGIAVRSGEPHPDVRSVDALRACLAHAPSLFCPDIERATAGIHFAKVLRELGLWPAAAARLAAYPSGAIAMRALADSTGPGAVGCTQVTEILYTPGVDLVATLPQAFALATTYAVAVSGHARAPALARRLAADLAGPATAELRVRGGFFPAPNC